MKKFKVEVINYANPEWKPKQSETTKREEIVNIKDENYDDFGFNPENYIDNFDIVKDQIGNIEEIK